MRIILAGGSGLVGQALIPLLSAHEVTLLTRRPLPDDLQQLHANVKDWGDAVARYQYDVAISTIGSTIKQAARAKPLRLSIAILSPTLRAAHVVLSSR